MKKIYLACVAITFAGTLQALAQDKGTSTIGASLGFGTSTEIADFAAEIITSPLNTTSAEETEVGATFGLTYRYAIKNNWNIFADGYYQEIKRTAYNSGGKIGEADFSYYTVGIGSDYCYLHKGIFKLYSGLAVGYTFEDASYSGNISSEDDGGFFNFHINALGVRVGKKLAGTAEVGFGYRGIINAGISYMF